MPTLERCKCGGMHDESSDSLPPPKWDSPAFRWALIAEAFAKVHETQEVRIEEEASSLGLDLGKLWDPLLNRPHAEKLRLFQERNPHLDLHRLETTEPYELAVGVLRMFTED